MEMNYECQGVTVPRGMERIDGQAFSQAFFKKLIMKISWDQECGGPHPI
jgi:hypothetical protein